MVQSIKIFSPIRCIITTFTKEMENLKKMTVMTGMTGLNALTVIPAWSGLDDGTVHVFILT